LEPEGGDDDSVRVDRRCEADRRRCLRSARCARNERARRIDRDLDLESRIAFPEASGEAPCGLGRDGRRRDPARLDDDAACAWLDAGETLDRGGKLLPGAADDLHVACSLQSVRSTTRQPSRAPRQINLKSHRLSPPSTLTRGRANGSAPGRTAPCCEVK